MNLISDDRFAYKFFDRSRFSFADRRGPNDEHLVNVALGDFFMLIDQI